MRRSRARPGRTVVGAILAAALLGAAPGLAQQRSAAQPGPLHVTVNHAEVVTLSDKAAVVLIANPDIADVISERNNVIFIVAHKPGATNLLVYDNAGKRLFEREVVVTAPEASTVTVTRLTDQSEYACNPRCTFSQHLAGAPTADSGAANAPPAPPPAPPQAAAPSSSPAR